MIRKSLRKIIQQLLFIFCTLRKKKYFQLISQKLIRIVKRNDYLVIPNKEKKEWHYFARKKLSTLLRRITSESQGHFFV